MTNDEQNDLVNEAQNPEEKHMLQQVKTAASRRYLVCVDGREECKVALRLACMKAISKTGQITLLHVVPPVDFQTLGSVSDHMRTERLQEGQELLSKMSKEAQDNFGINPTLLLLEGSAGDKIVETAMNDPNIIILVIGITHSQQSGKGKLSAWLASQLGDNLLIPILMVPGNLTDQQLSTLV
ncbi:MAG: universal stress protein [Rickettsiales bacterium]